MDEIEHKLEVTMPWVGIYIAAASAVCTLAMTADAFNGFRSKRLWFPSKYFSLNATTLTLLAVAMKLPTDLNTNMYTSDADWSAKHMSMLFIIAAMANFMSYLGFMSDKELLANVVALGILVITVSANVLTQQFLLWNEIFYHYVKGSMLGATILMLYLLVKLVSIAIMVPTIKRRLEAKYQELHKLVLMEEDVLNRRDAFVIENLRRGMMKYWVMAETSNTQFVMARSVLCTTSICFIFATGPVLGYIRKYPSMGHKFKSSYKASTMLVLVIQVIGVVIGSIAPTLRWFAAVSFKCSTETNWKSFKKAFIIESHWTQILVDYRESFSIRKGKCRKYLHNAKWFALTFCIRLQIFSLQLGKLTFVFSVLLTSPFFLCFILIKKIVNRLSTQVEESVDDMNLRLNRYVLLLEGEADLPNRVLKKMWQEANKMIQTGRKKQPQSLVHLLGKFVNFKGVAQFDSDQIPSLHSQKPPNCWTLPVVTLTSIAIALPNIPKHKVKKLLSSVSEGLSLAKLVDKTLDKNAQLINIRKAVDICWVGVELYMKWLDINLRKTSLNCTNSYEVLRELSIKAEMIIMKFKNEEKDPIMENPLNWPAKVVAANSMYRITQTILLSYDEENEQMDEGLFEQICVMIADILAACLTNLPRVITTMCHRNAIEKREKSVRKAFLLLGKTEQVVEVVQQQEWPHMDHDKAAYIQEWRALLLQNDDNDDQRKMPAESELAIERLLEAPMPWIGVYVAAASLICTLAMAADTFHGFWTKKYWFPSKYFSLNATSLTLIAVTMKLPVDLTTRMYTVTDRLAKISSLVFMSTAMANFLTSLGSMGDKDVLMNVTALGILVITVVVNVFIQIIQMHSYLKGRLAFPEELIAVCSMLLLLVMFTSSAVMIPSTKRYLETKYQEMHRSALVEEQVDVGGAVITTDKLRVLINKYWVMAETSSPQFVIARSVTCTTSGALSMLTALVLMEVQIRMVVSHERLLSETKSSYGWSTKWVLLAQNIGVVVGTIAPASRWFIAVNYRSLCEGGKNIKSTVRVEDYWTQKMVEWRQGSLSLQIRHLKSRKALHDLRGLFLKLCISVQYLIVLCSKLVLFVSIYVASPVVLLHNYVRGLKRQARVSHSLSSRDEESSVIPELDLQHYVMLLEGEVELSAETLENICKEVDAVIHKGKMKKPKNLLKLLYKSCNFKGVTEFDSYQVPSLHSQDLPYCWSLPVATLGCIALAIPNTDREKSRCLLTSVTEGLRFVKLIDKTMDKKRGLANIRTAADVFWVKVELYHKWQDKDLHETSLKGKNAEEILQELCDEAEKTVLEFKREAKSCLMRNPLNWPAKVIAANSMYRVCKTILVNESDKTDEELFEELSIMIADILAACLTNLANVIMIKCRRNAIEEREKSVRKAAFLLGETEDILALLQQCEWPILAPEKAADIEEWRALIKLENKNNQDSFPKIERDVTIPGEECITINVDG